MVGQFNDQNGFGDGCGFCLTFLICLFLLLELAFGAPIQLVHIPKNGAQPIYILLVQIGNSSTVGITLRLRSKDRQDILPHNGIATIVGLDFLAVTFYAVFDFFQPVPIFFGKQFYGLLHTDSILIRGLCCEKDAISGPSY